MDDAQPSQRPTKPARRERLRHQKVALTNRATATVERLEQQRSASRFIDVGFAMYEGDRARGGSLLAGALAFRFFMLLVPYVVVMMAGFGFAADAAEQSSRTLANRAGIEGLAAKAISNLSTLSTGQRIVILTIATVALFSGARALVRALRLTSTLLWAIPVQPRRGAAREALVFIGAVTLSLVVGDLLGRARAQSFTLGLILTLAAVGLPAAMALGLWSKLPHDPRALWTAHWPGALLFGIAVQGLHLFTVLYLARSFTTKSETYGALGSAIAILLWAYILGRSVVLAIGLNVAAFRDLNKVDL